MTAAARIETQEPVNVFDLADEHLRQAMAACGRLAFREAIQQVSAARHILETEEAFREAQRMRT